MLYQLYKPVGPTGSLVTFVPTGRYTWATAPSAIFVAPWNHSNNLMSSLGPAVEFASVDPDSSSVTGPGHGGRSPCLTGQGV